MQDISVTEAASQLEQAPDDTILLDVREVVELEMAAVAGAVHIPMQEIPQRLDDLDKDKTILCLCHSGGRSAQVAHYLESQGFSRVQNVSGGIDAWSLDINPEIPRY